MGAGFDPDRFLAETTPKDFDPDAFLAETGDTVAPEGDQPSAFMRHVAQKLPGGFGNQLMAAEHVAKTRIGKAAAAGLSGGGLSGAADALMAPGAVDEYRQARDELTSKEEAEPSFAGDVVGMVPSLAIPGGSTLKGAMGAGAALGGAQALAESKGDLTRGQVGQAALDTIGGAAAGGAGGAAGYGLGKLASAAAAKVAGWVSPKVAEAGAEIGRLAQEQGGEEVQQLAGKLGGEVQKGSRMAENLRRVGSRLAPEAGERLQSMEPDLVNLERRVAQGNMRDLPGQVGTIDAAQAALEQAQKNLPARVAELAASIGNPLNQVMPRLQRYLPPVLGDFVGGASGQTALGALARGAVGAGVGYAAGGDAKGAVVGALAGAGMRPAFQSILRGIRHPSVQRAVWNAVLQMSQKSAGFLGRYGPMLGRVAASSLDDAFALHQSLMAHAPDYAEKVARGLEGAAATEQVEPIPEGP